VDKNILVIGIGNKYRSDDGIGIYVAEKIREKKIPNITVSEAIGEGTSLIDLWKDNPKVIIVDAASSGNKPGTIHRFEAHKEKIPSKLFGYSTHAFSLAEAIELSRALGNLPKCLIIFGIEGENYTDGSELSERLKASVNEIVKIIEEEIEKLKKENQYA
jgi:hydrogenase maturation protease